MHHHSRRTGRNPVDHERLHQSSLVLHALAHPLRIRMLSFIDANESVCVNQIYANLALEQSVTSQHLRVLREADLVCARRDGKFVRYTLNYEKIASSALTARSLAILVR
jgi:DNA-binding transcriptional ArsR family regulator